MEDEIERLQQMINDMEERQKKSERCKRCNGFKCNTNQGGQGPGNAGQGPDKDGPGGPGFLAVQEAVA